MDIGPYNFAEAHTKSDTVDLVAFKTKGPTDALWVGGAGIVVAVFEDGSTAQFTCVAGTVLPVAIKRVNSTTTTATLLVALWRI